MAANSRAKKAPDVKDVLTRYEVCRLDGSDSRTCPDGWTHSQAKEEAERLNKQCALGKTEPSAAHPNGQVLNSHINDTPTPVRHAGMGGSGIYLPDGGELYRVAKYEVRTHLVEAQ